MGTPVLDILAAETTFSQLIEEVAAGKEVIIAKAGIPLARLVPIGAVSGPKKLGLLKGKIEVADDFNACLGSDALNALEN